MGCGLRVLTYHYRLQCLLEGAEIRYISFGQAHDSEIHRDGHLEESIGASLGHDLVETT